MKREIGWEFESYEEGVRIIEDWIYFYNYIRPHSSIGYKTPYEKWKSMNIKVIA
jgi:transposase InsO family protein